MERDRVVRFLEGQIAEISHTVSHIRSGDVEYIDSLTEIAHRMRTSVRAAAPLVGAAVVEAVMRYTDQVTGEIDSFASGEEGSNRLEKISLYLYGALDAANDGSRR